MLRDAFLVRADFFGHHFLARTTTGAPFIMDRIIPLCIIIDA